MAEPTQPIGLARLTKSSEMVIIFALKFMIKPTKEDVAAAREVVAH